MQFTKRFVNVVFVLALASMLGACSGLRPTEPSPAPGNGGGGGNPGTPQVSAITLMATNPVAPADIKVTKLDPRTKEIMPGSGALVVTMKWFVSDADLALAKANGYDIGIAACLWTKTQNGDPIEVGCAGTNLPDGKVSGQNEAALRVSYDFTPWITQTDSIKLRMEFRKKTGEAVGDGIARDTALEPYNWINW